MGMGEEKQLNNIERSYGQKGQRGIDAADRNVGEAEQIKEVQGKINPHDGLIHQDDGTMVDPTDGSPIEAEQLQKPKKKKVKDFYDRDMYDKENKGDQNYLPSFNVKLSKPKKVKDIADREVD